MLPLPACLAPLVLSVPLLNTPDWMTVAGDVGINAEMLAYCGLSSTDAAALLASLQDNTAIAEQVVAKRGDIRLLQSDLATQRRNGASPQDEAVRTLTASIDAGQRELKVLMTQYFEVAVSAAPQGSRTALRAWRSSAGTKLPPSFRVVPWTAQELKELEGSLRAEERSQRANTELASEHTSRLTAARGRTEVMGADASATDNLSSLQLLLRAYQ